MLDIFDGFVMHAVHTYLWMASGVVCENVFMTRRVCRHALREYNIHKKLEQARIVRLFDVFEIDNNS